MQTRIWGCIGLWVAALPFCLSPIAGLFIGPMSWQHRLYGLLSSPRFCLAWFSVVAVAALFLVPAFAKLEIDDAPMMCACGYDLRGCESSRCPECGRSVGPVRRANGEEPGNGSG